jgi:predicted HicB family RNase H-like nuclease
MEYKGYHGHVTFDDEVGIFHGEVIDLKDVITFQGDSAASIQEAFKASIDDYLAFCAERGEEPDRPFSGRLMVRLNGDLHRNLYVKAKASGKSLNEYISDVLADYGC